MSLKTLLLKTLLLNTVLLNTVPLKRLHSHGGLRSIVVGLALLIVSATAAGCGGGGGTGGPGGTPGPGGGGPDPILAQIFEDCIPAVLAESGDLSRLISEILQGNGAAQGVQLPTDGMGGFIAMGPPVDPIPHLDWEHDPGGQGMLDGTGTTDFLDDMGDPLAAFDEPQMDTLRAGGIDALGALLATLADGTVATMHYAGAVPGTGILSIDITYTGAAPGNATGRMDLDITACQAALSFLGIPFSGLTSIYPNGTFTLEITAGADQVQATITATGGPILNVSATRNGGLVTNWTFDLDTGIATQI